MMKLTKHNEDLAFAKSSLCLVRNRANGMFFMIFMGLMGIKVRDIK